MTMTEIVVTITITLPEPEPLLTREQPPVCRCHVRYGTKAA